MDKTGTWFRRILRLLWEVGSAVGIGNTLIVGALSVFLLLVFWALANPLTALAAAAVIFGGIMSGLYAWARHQSLASANVSIVYLDSSQPQNWGGDHRLTVEVHNDGPDGTFEAWILSGVRGIGETHYGDFKVQWDLEKKAGQPIPRYRSRKLHVARAGQGWLRFLGPKTIYKPLTQYKVLLPAGDVRAELDIRDTASGAKHTEPIRIGFDDKGLPFITADEPHGDT